MLPLELTWAAHQVLQAIRRSPIPIAKASIARATGLSASSVSEHVDNLLRNELVVEVALGPSSGGRRPQLLSFNAGAGYLVCVDLESTSVQVGIADFGCQILVSESSDIDVAVGPREVLECIKDMLFALLDRQGIDRSQIKGIGMGVPGPVDFSTALPASLPIMPGWDRYPIREFWEKYLDCPCYVDNNVNTMAAGEHAIALRYEVDNLLFVKTGNGIGTGIICNGQIYRGAAQFAGNIGHIDIGHNVPCYCGNTGCLEAVAGGRAVVARAEELASEGRSELLAAMLAENGRLRVRDIALAVKSADLAAVELIRECGAQIGLVLSGLVNFFNPSHIYFGGSLAQVGDALLASIRQAVYYRSLPVATRDLVIQQSALGQTVGLVGAAVMTVDQIILDRYVGVGRARLGSR